MSVATAAAVLVPHSSLSKAGSWPDETPEKRNHRIRFYATFGVQLDPTSSLSFTEQVLKGETFISGHRRYILSLPTYEDKVKTPGRKASETILMRTTKSGTLRVLHSHNMFDVMSDLHDKHHNRNGFDQMNQCQRASLLCCELSVTLTNATNFVASCRLCRPVNATPVKRNSSDGADKRTHGQSAQGVLVTPTATSTPTRTKASEKSTPGPKKRTARELRQDAAGLAYEFVHEVNNMVNSMQRNSDASSSNDTIRILNTEGLYVTVARLLVTQHKFHEAGKPTKIDLGYHYTRNENVSSISKLGLMTSPERQSNSVIVGYNGAVYGDGIYTASNPVVYYGKYGGVGLVVARLMGSNETYDKTTKGHGDSGTVARNQFGEVVVMASSEQCAALLQFDANQISPNMFTHPGNLRLAEYQVELQSIVDRMLNALYDDTQFTGRNIKAKQGPVANHGLGQTQVIPCRNLFTPGTLQYVAPLSFTGQTRGFIGILAVPLPFRDTWKCALCHQGCAATHISQITVCQHAFHTGCLNKSLQTNASCPSCHKSLGPPQGKMPSGTMLVSRSTDTCSGFANTHTICMEYKIPQARQMPFHAHPGVKHDSVHRRAYLPETLEGCDLLKRLKYAFMHGLCFTVGVSLTTGRDNSVTWSSIPHKTSLSGGPARFGYPDPNYFLTCHNELDKLEVPKASDL